MLTLTKAWYSTSVFCYIQEEIDHANHLQRLNGQFPNSSRSTLFNELEKDYVYLALLRAALSLHVKDAREQILRYCRDFDRPATDLKECIDRFEQVNIKQLDQFEQVTTGILQLVSLAGTFITTTLTVYIAIRSCLNQRSRDHSKDHSGHSTTPSSSAVVNTYIEQFVYLPLMFSAVLSLSVLSHNTLMQFSLSSAWTSTHSKTIQTGAGIFFLPGHLSLWRSVSTIIHLRESGSQRTLEIGVCQLIQVS